MFAVPTRRRVRTGSGRFVRRALIRRGRRVWSSSIQQNGCSIGRLPASGRFGPRTWGLNEITMVVAIVIAVAGLALVSVAYGNRNDLSHRTTVRQAVAYLVSGVLVVGLAVLVFRARTGQATNGSRGRVLSPGDAFDAVPEKVGSCEVSEADQNTRYRCAGSPNRSRAACLLTPSTAPICVQVRPFARAFAT